MQAKCVLNLSSRSLTEEGNIVLTGRNSFGSHRTRNAWWLLGASVAAYALAWFSHFFIEGNKPATFGHPFWSLRADFRMYGRMLTGQLGRELERLGISEE